MITQNPITGRSRKKLAGVYARTLWGMNIIQSCPGPSKVPPSAALKSSRTTFGHVMMMANQVDAWLLTQIYYTAPVGRSRRHLLSKQLFAGVVRNNGEITYNLEAISQLGTNPVSTTIGLIYTIPAKSFTLPKSSFPYTTAADTSKQPCVFAISYDLGLCVPLLSYTELVGDDISFTNISDTFIGQRVLLLCLWQVNIGTTQTPVWQFGRFQLVS